MAEEVFENYFGKDIVFKQQDGTAIAFPSLGYADITMKRDVIGSHASVPLLGGSRTPVIDCLPPPRKGVRYIVSGNVAALNKGAKNMRVDLVVPDVARTDFPKDGSPSVLSIHGFLLS